MIDFDETDFHCGSRVRVDRNDEAIEGTVTNIRRDLDGGAMLTIRTDEGQYHEESAYDCQSVER
ncbi:hypothetical protein [uncultured Salinicola sp.]|uniref:hypothetical protein n=1 Tax=uncultured Salinicola sp. TaxID=1193542 RepID=UPI00262971F4|nr:hypothetical protein [uncultured Salinicola sp.]